ncbi:hypothetical protein EUX98_g3870 [Antrodiella citrinella]|uniref:Uncharacterized protein n=1 Tax=Antrodiella citrinella TaxID=2447956 RepID=A0A4S4N3J6_9APHY|nr:hypothetical protein EUX98_g3870 [Antrodiella citrinella]
MGDPFAFTGLLDPVTTQLPSICIVFGVSGAYLWEFLTSLDFERSFLTRQKTFTWPMISYFAGRYIALLAVLIALANIFASINLGIRAMAVWNFKPSVVISLTILLIAQGVLLIGEVVTCAIAQNIFFGSFLLASLGYLILVDVIIYALTASKICRLKHKTLRTRLLDRMLSDGLVYFLFVIAVNLVVLVILVLGMNLNTFPSAIISSVRRYLVSKSNRELVTEIADHKMLSNRLVRRVSNFSTTAPAIYLATEGNFAFEPVATKNLDLSGLGPAGQ